MECKDENNGHVAIDLDKLEMTSVNTNQTLFRDLKKLVKKSITEFQQESEQTQQIRKLLEKHSDAIYNTNIKGENIFHVIAEQPDRNEAILSLFGLDNEGNSERVVPADQIERLLQMPWQSRKRRFPIHLAVANGFVPFVRKILEICPNLVAAQDADGNTPLHIATMSSSPESTECLKLIISILEKTQLVEEILCTVNHNGRTALHTLCSNVPRNLDAQVATKLRKLMGFKCVSVILKTMDKLHKTPLHILCSRNEQSKGFDLNKNVRALLEILMEFGADITNQKTQDEHEQTPLHLLAVAECPVLMKILVSHGSTKVCIKDAKGKMAIHYAAETALRPKSQECVKLLADWESMKGHMRIDDSDTTQEQEYDLFRRYLLWETFTDKNEKKWTAMTLACHTRSTKTVEYILKNVYKAKNNFGIWFAQGEENEELYSLNQVYQRTPAALEFLFDKSIRMDWDQSNENRIVVVTDLSVITALTRPFQEDSTFSEMKYLSYASEWPEDVQKRILLHPLVQFSLNALGEKMLPYKLIWLVWNVLWLISYCILVPFEYSESYKRYPTAEVVAAWILGVQSVLYLVDELISIKAFIKRLFSCESHSKIVLIQIFLTLVTVYKPCALSMQLSIDGLPNKTIKLCAASGILVSFMIFWRNIGLMYSPLGVHVEYMNQTLKKIIIAFFCIVPWIIGFQRAFCQILPEFFTSTPAWSVAKTLVMMTGEFDFGEMYEMYKNESANDAENLVGIGSIVSFETSSIVVFLFFLILLPVSFYNLVTGVVVDKVKSMQDQLEMYQIRNQIRIMNYVQSNVIAKLELVKWAFQCLTSCFITYRQTKDGQVIFDQEVRWLVDKNVNVTCWSVLCHSFQVCRCYDKGEKHEDQLCGNLLPKSLKRKLFQDYEENLNEYIFRNESADFELM